MVTLSQLWLPILVSAVFVFVASSIIHMATPWHKDDYSQVPNEDKVMEALRPFNLPPGDYMMPRPANMQDMSSPEFAEKRNKGPVMVFTVMPSGPFSMGKNLGYSVALWQFSIWYHRSWGTTIRSTVDGLIYALLTAGVFGWLWPH